LKTVNLQGVAEVLRLARCGAPKFLHYASTLSVFVGSDRNSGVAREDDDLRATKSLFGGYAQSKWAAEMLVRRAAPERGAAIYRLGLLTGDSQTAVMPANDLLTMTLVGYLTAGFLGNAIVRMSERLIERLPVVSGIYSAVKQIFETLFKKQSSAFRDVVLVQYPRPECWAIGFITGTAAGEIQDVAPGESVNIFLPTTPNPTSGFLLFLPGESVRKLNMTVEEGLKMVVSGGIVTPPDRRPEAAQAIKQVAHADGDTQTIPAVSDDADATPDKETEPVEPR